MRVQRVLGGLVIAGCTDEESEVLYNTLFAAVCHYKLTMKHIGPMPVVDQLVVAFSEDIVKGREKGRPMTGYGVVTNPRTAEEKLVFVSLVYEEARLEGLRQKWEQFELEVRAVRVVWKF